MEFSGNLYHCLVPSSGAMRMSEQRKGSTQTVPPSEASSANREPSAKEQAWEKNTLQPTLKQSPERQAEFTTISGHPIRRLYTKADLPNWDPDRDLGFPGEPHNVDDHQFSCRGHLGDVSGRRGKARRGLEENLRHASERHLERVHRTEGIHLPTGTLDAPSDRYVRIRRQEHSEVQHHFDQRLSHPRGRLDRHPGTRLHSARRSRIRRMGNASRP